MRGPFAYELEYTDEKWGFLSTDLDKNNEKLMNDTVEWSLYQKWQQHLGSLVAGNN